MKVNREQLLNTLELVSPGLSNKGDLDQSDCFVFKDGRLVTFNDETACEIKSPMEVTGAVKADKLKRILHRLKEEELDVTQEKGKLSFKGKSRRRFWVRLEKKIELPLENLEKPKKWKPLHEKFGDAVEFVEGCAGKDEAQLVLTYIHVHPKYLEAFDNYQFARFRVKTPLKKEFLVKQISLRNIINLTMIEFAETRNWVHFRNARKLVMSCRRYLDEYLDLNHVTKVTGTRISLPPGLADGSENAAIFAEDNPQDKGEILIELSPGWVKVQGTGQYGEYRERKKVAYKNEPHSFMIKPKMIVQLIKNHSEYEVNKHYLKAGSPNAVFVTSLAPTDEKKEEKK